MSGPMVDARPPAGVRSAVMTTRTDEMRAERDRIRAANLERQRRLDAALGFTPERPCPPPTKRRMSAAATKRVAKNQPKPNAVPRMRSADSYRRYQRAGAMRRAMRGVSS